MSGTVEQNLCFPGQYFLIESGLSYNWHRFYDPATGRYTQPDPLRFVDGPSVYGYAGASPLMRVDPEGEQVVPVSPLLCLQNPIACASLCLIVPSACQSSPDPQQCVADGAPWSPSGPITLPSKEHTKNSRPSTEEKHEKGKARKGRDQGGEKGDDRRKRYGKRPPGWKGKWPPT